ncbi:serine/threonine-protein kinase [Acidobacteriota bacterium]
MAPEGKMESQERPEMVCDTVCRAPSMGVTRRSSWALPPAMFTQAVRRLHMFCLLYAIGFAIAYFPTSILSPVAGLSNQPVETVAAISSICFALFVFFWTRRTCCPSAHVLNFALVFEVVAALGISVSEFWGFLGPDKNPAGIAWSSLPWAGISWVCMLVVIFPLIVPGTPRKVILGSLGAASTGPLVVLLSIATGNSPRVPPIAVFLLFLPNIISVITAYFCSRIVYRLGSDITKARELGSYQLVDRLGKGGMGEVWRARHRMLVRPAAIKLVTPEALGSVENGHVVLQRFEREAQATATLHSPHTIELYDFGITDEGNFYYVMEFLNGLDLDLMVKRYGAVCQERMIFLLRQVCHSLMEAHEKCLIHRDIKPANIYACRYGRDFDFVKVLDFGLVKSNNEFAEKDARLTLEGVPYGTPAYMAPEMVLGKTEIDGRADIYALGCVAYWLVTGHRPFESKSAVEMVIDHVKTTPRRPSEISELELAQEVEEIILSCLEKDPADRPQTAHDLLAALESCRLENSWTPERAREWWQLHQP